ncbi:hypothetical protein EVG20_g3230 [Dentipellis fragilis]|uniref:C2 domain-containing protein n=1 Tax=Dentipellis fragilis TaxID=205917 RepID=A0A4Y9Z3M7_9AGAM|nr:hypothetical protein EVG20_g3230 [Dentipellis fragilis]
MKVAKHGPQEPVPEGRFVEGVDSVVKDTITTAASTQSCRSQEHLRKNYEMSPILRRLAMAAKKLLRGYGRHIVHNFGCEFTGNFANALKMCFLSRKAVHLAASTLGSTQSIYGHMRGSWSTFGWSEKTRILSSPAHIDHCRSSAYRTCSVPWGFIVLQMSATRVLVVTVIRAESLTLGMTGNLLCREPNALVELTVGSSTTRSTKVVKHSRNPVWKEDLLFANEDVSSIIAMKVKDQFGVSRTIGTVQPFRFNELQPDVPYRMSLKPTGSIAFSVRFESDRIGVERAFKGIEHSGIHQVPTSLSGLTVSQSLVGVIGSLEDLMGLADAFSEIHPFVHVAWKTVSAAYQVVKTSLDRDAKVLDLVDTMGSLYSFVMPVQAMAEAKQTLTGPLEKTIKDIMIQTIECIVFVREYSGHGFASRTVRYAASFANKKIDGYMKAFENLAASFNTGLAVQGGLVTLRIVNRVEETTLKARLQPREISWSDRDPCQPGTCLEIIDLVTRWALETQSDGSKVLWLHGVAGSGKSTLARTLASLFASLRRLGAFIFFDRAVAVANEPMTFVRTLAWELSRFDRRIQERVLAAMDTNVHAARMELRTQFRELIEQPLAEVFRSAGPVDKCAPSQEGPIIVIVDGLDECGDSERERRHLVELLAQDAARLPPTVRIIVTSRPEPDIAQAFRFQNAMGYMRPMALPNASRLDMEEYIHKELADIARRFRPPDNWLEPNKVEQLIRHADGLWMWAYTACRYIDSYEPQEQLEQVLAIGRNSRAFEGFVDKFGSLWNLYLGALDSSRNRAWKNDRFKSDALSILGVILVVKTPISPNAIDDFLILKSVGIISQLQSVLRNEDRSKPVRIHESLRDFLSDSDNMEHPWFVDIAVHKRRFAIYCLAVMHRFFSAKLFRKELRWIPKSYLDSDEALNYACSNWINHICALDSCDTHLHDWLSCFASQHLMHWFEAMSLISQSRSTSQSLDNLVDWMKTYIPNDSALHELISDASRFAAFFARTIELHHSLIQLGALPFSPVESRLYKTYHHSDLPTVRGGYLQSWSPTLRTFRCTDQMISSLAFSSDQSRVVTSGYSEVQKYNIRVWDVSTGKETLKPIEINGLGYVAFSSSGSTIWCATEKGSIQLRDSGTGLLVTPKLKRSQWDRAIDTWDDEDDSDEDGNGSKYHRSKSIAPYVDPGLNHLRSMSHSYQTWSERRPKVVTRRRTPTDIIRAAFSPSKATVILGSEGGKLYVIDWRTGRQRYSAPQDPTSGIQPEIWRERGTICFSPNETSYASVAGDDSIRIRQTYRNVSGPAILFGHNMEVTAVAYINDAQILSSSIDRTIRLWDIAKAEQLHVVNMERWVIPIKFCPRGKKLAALPMEKNTTVEIVDCSTGKITAPSLEGLPGDITSLAFSANGARLASAALFLKNGIHIWDVGPLNISKISPQVHKHGERSHGKTETKYWDPLTGEEIPKSYTNLKGHRPKANKGLKRNGPTAIAVPLPFRVMPPAPLSVPELSVSPHGRLILEANGQTIWRIPDEIGFYDTHDIRGPLVAFGTSSGHVLIWRSTAYDGPARIPNDWKWTRTLAFPLDDLAKLKLSPTPFKWIRYATGVVVGAQGDLSYQRDPFALVNYDDPLPGESLELYYHVSDEEKLHMFPLDPLLANSRTATPSAKSTRQANFGGEVMQRDGGRKGSSYIEAFTRGRHRGPDDENDIIDDIDSVRNGLFLDKALHAELGSDFAILVTPNFAMDTSDVDVQPGTYCHGRRYTAHFFDLPSVEVSNLPGRAIRTPEKMSEWPPTVLFDAVYASAVLHHFGVIPPKTLDPWNDIFYPGERTATEQVDEQRRREEEAKEDEQTEQSRLERNERYMQRSTGGSAMDGIDLLMLPYMLIPRDQMAKYAEERQEALAEEEREVLEAKVSSWRDNVRP